MEPVRRFIRDQFNVNLKVWHNIPLEDQDTSVHNIVPVIESLDPWVLNSVFQCSQATKSAAVSFKLIWRGASEIEAPLSEKYSLEDAIRCARVDEQHQQSIFGVVEGSHDFD